MLLVKQLTLPNKKNLNLEIHKNQGLTLTAPNGHGKSLLLKSLAFLHPIKFEIFEFQGKSILEWTPHEYRRRVAYVASLPSLGPHGNVDDYLKAPWELSVYQQHKSTFDCGPYLEKWNLNGLKLSFLSSGQRQLLSLLRAISLDPTLLLLDEPTSHLDTAKTIEVEKLLLEWRERTQGSFIMVSHDEAQVKRIDGKKIIL